MAKTLQFRRGTTSELSTQTGAVGELFVDTTKDTVVVMDGSTPGGFPLQSELVSGANIKSINGQSLLGSGDITITGGSGSSFDQSLNTIDDVVFNSALVGNVSIVDNVISATDSYGNNSEILVNAPLTIVAGEVGTNTVLYNDILTNAGYLLMSQGSSTIQIEFLYQNVKELLMALNPGDTFTLRNASNNELLTYTFESSYESGSVLLIIVREYNTSGSQIEFSQTYLELNYYTNTSVNVLEATETGINVNGTFTVNGQPVSGSGSTYDQSLNTTDDVVFNSALVGDVSIISNTISGLDSYGNAGTLIVNSDLEVSIGEIYSSNPVIFQFYNYDVSFFGPMGSLIGESFLTEVYNNDPTSTPTVSLTVNHNGNDYVVTGRLQSLSSFGYSLANAIQVYFDMTSNITINGLSVIDFNNTYGISQLSSATVNYGSTITALTANSSGINVNGTLTVNGQPISGGGSSYDQSLNTTNDVVFKSVETEALDVHIHEESITNYELQYDNMYGSYGYFQDYPWSRRLDIYNFSGQNNEIINYFVSKHSGDVVYFNFNTMYGNSAGYAVINSVANYGSQAYVYFSNVVYTGGSLYYNGATLYSGSKFIDQYIFDARPLSVDRNGVVLSGVTTADDIVANSALIGDISIVGNNIAAHDPYGNAHILSVSASDVVFDASFNLAIDTSVPTTETIFAGGASQFYINSNSISFSGGSPSFDITKLKTGTLVSVGDIYTIRLTSDFAYNNMYGEYRANSEVISGNIGVSGNTSGITVTNAVETIVNYSFDDQGTLSAPAISTDSLLINGSAPSFLTVNQDGSKSIEVPKTITTSYSGLYWMSAMAAGSMDPSRQGKVIINSPNQNTFDVLNSLVAGDKVTFKYDPYGNGQYQDYTVTVQTAGFNYDMNMGSYVLDVVEVNNNMGSYSLDYTQGISTETTASQEYNFAGDALTASNIIADSALIGDVSIAGNTISGLDSYGNADTLIVEGDLRVVNSGTSTTNYAYNVDWDGFINWNGSNLIWNNPSIALPLIQSLKIGDTITFQDSMNVSVFVTVTLTSTLAYDMGFMAYVASVAEDNTSGMAISAANNPISITSTAIVTPLAVENSTVTLGDVKFMGPTDEIPALSGQAKKWLKVQAMAPEILLSDLFITAGELYQSGDISLDPVQVTLNGLSATTYIEAWLAIQPGDTFAALIMDQNNNQSWYTLTATTPGMFNAGTATIGVAANPIGDVGTVVNVKLTVQSEGTNLTLQTFYLPLYK